MFNLGIGMVVVVPQASAPSAVSALAPVGGRVIGTVVAA